MSKTICPNCQAAIKKGILVGNVLFDDRKNRIISKYSGNNSSIEYCNKCGDSLYLMITGKIKEKIAAINSAIEEKAKNVVILTTHTPMGWDYRALGIVTAQTTTGTGVLAEFTSGFTDFFGAQSGAYNAKLANGELSCFSQIRMKTLGLGGNAVIATDIDYSEVGGAKGMLMVCMAGTAVSLINTEILGPDKSNELKDIDKLVSRLRNLKSDLG